MSASGPSVPLVCLLGFLAAVTFYALSNLTKILHVAFLLHVV